MRGTDGNAGKVPVQIAEGLSGRQFKDFNEFREVFWKEVAADPVLSKQFSPENQKLIERGLAPFATGPQQVGKRMRYELDHNVEIRTGGGVYDLDNIIIRTPYNHIKKGGVAVGVELKK